MIIDDAIHYTLREKVLAATGSVSSLFAKVRMQVQDRQEVSERREDAGIFMTCFFFFLYIYIVCNALKNFESVKEKQVAENYSGPGKCFLLAPQQTDDLTDYEKILKLQWRLE